MSPLWVSAVLSAVHVLAIALSLASAWARWRALRVADVDRILAADNVWGISALLILGSGLGRLFGPVEKGLAWYLANPLFLHKMILFVAILVLEIWPMVTFIRWAHRARAGRRPGPPPRASARADQCRADRAPDPDPVRRRRDGARPALVIRQSTVTVAVAPVSPASIVHAPAGTFTMS